MDWIKKMTVSLSRKSRDNLGLTQTMFAKLMGVSQPTVSAWESGASEPSPQQDSVLLVIQKAKHTESTRSKVKKLLEKSAGLALHHAMQGDSDA